MHQQEGQAYKEWIAGVFGRGADNYSQIGPQFFQHFGRNLVDYADIPEGATVLDVACGRGASLLPTCELVGTSGRVVGIDISADMVNETREEIRRRQLNYAEVNQMDAEHLQFDDGAFDFALCGLALFFFPNVDQALTEILRVLKPGGVFVASTFGEEDALWEGLNEIFRAYRERLAPAPKANTQQLGKQEEIIKIFSRPGFAEIETFSVSKTLYHQDLDRWWETLWSHAARSFLERLDEADLATLKEESFAWAERLLSEKGLPETWNILITRARVPES